MRFFTENANARGDKLIAEGDFEEFIRVLAKGNKRLSLPCSDPQLARRRYRLTFRFLQLDGRLYISSFAYQASLFICLAQ